LYQDYVSYPTTLFEFYGTANRLKTNKMKDIGGYGPSFVHKVFEHMK